MLAGEVERLPQGLYTDVGRLWRERKESKGWGIRTAREEAVLAEYGDGINQENRDYTHGKVRGSLAQSRGIIVRLSGGDPCVVSSCRREEVEQFKGAYHRIDGRVRTA